MSKAFLAAAALMAASVITFGQQQPAQPAAPAPAAQPAAPAPPESTSPVAKQPQPKSQAEMQALQGLFQAQDPDARIKAVDEFVTKFPDSEFKGFGLMIAAETARQKNDHEKAIIYAERSLEADPQSFMAMIILSSELAGTTREHDLDREEKLKRAEKYANQSIEVLKTAPRPRPDVTDEQWASAKKEFESQAHVSLGLAQLVRKNCGGAITELVAATGTPVPDPAALIRLGMAYTQCGKPDEAIGAFDKVIASPDAPAPFKQYAQQEKQKAVQKKGGAAPAAPAQPKP